MNPYLVYAIGFIAQGFFSVRILTRWIPSGRAKKVFLPSIFQIFSLTGSVLLFIYGWLRNDSSIIFGQLITYHIHIWNLQTRGVWQRLPWFLRIAVGLLPVIAIVGMLSDIPSFTQNFFHNTQAPLYLFVIGSLGQLIFTLRFVYQWYYSYQRHASLLPLGLWIISPTGGGTIVIYGIIRRDPVLILGQSLGFVAHARNIVLLSRQRKTDGQ